MTPTDKMRSDAYLEYETLDRQARDAWERWFAFQTPTNWQAYSQAARLRDAARDAWGVSL